MPEHDVLVVGGGVAGLRAAIEAKRQGRDVALLSKSHPLRSHSCTAQAGINAPLAKEDSWEAFAEDTVRGGDFLNERHAAEVLAREAAEAALELDAWGVPFSRDPSGRLAARRLSGAGYPRALFAADITGHVILHTLYEQLLRAQVVPYDECQALALAVTDGACHGVVARELRTGRVFGIAAGAVVLATGGMGQAYRRSTASLGCTGDGVALAYEAGATLMDMEMVQFHPTVLAGRGVLVSEAALAEGAVLRRADGRAVADSFAPRHALARAAEEQIAVGNGAQQALLLDATGVNPERAAKNLKHTRELVKALTGLDLLRQPIPVRPAMHRAMGGVRTDLDGATSIPGLYAAGECACAGVHGGNRLGGNTLTEAVVFGKRAGASAAKHASNAARKPLAETYVRDVEGRMTEPLRRPPGEDSLARIRSDLQDLMERKAGMFRDGPGLAQALAGVRGLRDRLGRVGLADTGRAFSSALSGYAELGSLLTCAEAVVVAAQTRTETRGAHVRTDLPARDDAAWLRHTLVRRAAEGPRVETAPVTVTRWTPT